MSSQNSAGLSAEYWALHRNSLIFSGLLFVTCLLSETITVKILDIEFSGINVRQVGFLLSISACYAMAVLYLEWRGETRSVFNERNGRYRDLMSALQTAEQELRKSREQLNDLSEDTGKLARALREGKHAARFEIVADTITARFRERMHDHRQGYSGSIKDETCRQPIRDAVSSVVNTSISNLETAFNELPRLIESRQVKDTKELSENVQTITYKLEEICEAITIRHNHEIKNIRSINIEILIDWVRLVGISLWVPLTLFVFGISHYVGAAGLHLFGSPIVRLIKSLK